MAENNTTLKPRSRTLGGTGHLPAKERALRRERRVAERKAADALSDDSGAPAPAWAKELKGAIENLIAALKK